MDISEKIERGVDLITEVAFESGWESALGEVQDIINELKERIHLRGHGMFEYDQLENEIAKMLKNRGENIERKPVKSSDIKSIGYDPENKILEIEFSPERVYQYSKVPAEIHSDIMGAPSKGKFFHTHIMWKYQFRQIKGDKK